MNVGLLVSLACILIGSFILLVVAWERRETRRDQEWR